MLWCYVNVCVIRITYAFDLQALFSLFISGSSFQRYVVNSSSISLVPLGLEVMNRGYKRNEYVLCLLFFGFVEFDCFPPLINEHFSYSVADIARKCAYFSTFCHNILQI